MSELFSGIRPFLAAGIVLTAFGLICLLVFSADDPRTAIGDTEQPETREGPFRELLTDRIIAGNLDCDFRLRTETLACLAFQTAIGAYDPPGFSVTEKQSYAAHSENISTLYAVEVMNQIVTVLPGNRYMLGYRVLGMDVEHPGTDAEMCLDLGYGACGNHTATFLELMELLDIDARPILFFYSKDGKHFSHIAAEAYLGGKWRFFDLTYGAFYTNSRDLYNIYSIEKLVKLEKNQMESLRISYDTGLLGLSEAVKSDIHRYIYLNHTLLYGYDRGEVFISRDRFSDGKVDLGDITNFVGDNIDNGPFEGIRYALDNPALTNMLMSVSGIGGCSETSRICLNDDCRAVHAHPYEFRNVPKGSRLRIEAALPICYVVLKSIEFDSENQTSK